MYTENILSLTQLPILAVKKDTLYCMMKNNRVLLNKGCFWNSKSDKSVEKGVFLRPKSAKKGSFSNLDTSMDVRFDRK